MNIVVKEFVTGAREAEGVTVIIDVFRAFSTACYAFSNGISRLINVATPKEAFALRDKLQAGSFIAGEQNEIIPEGFDFGNSPTEMITADISGKTMIHCTTAGTKGVVNATGATEILAASLVNAGAVASYIAAKQPEKVTLVAMGYRATMSADEDMLCAEVIRNQLNGVEMNMAEEINKLRSGAGLRFFEHRNLTFSPPTDFFLSTDLNRFNFILKAIPTAAGHAEIIRIDMER